jgi:hypothetical protein
VHADTCDTELSRSEQQAYDRSAGASTISGRSGQALTKAFLTPFSPRAALSAVAICHRLAVDAGQSQGT